MKKISFLGNSLDALKAFPEPARHDAGYQHEKVQHGVEPTNWKPMPTIGSGVNEIRIRDKSGIYRIVYVAKHKSVVYVLHAFIKKGQKTPKKDIELAKKRLDLIQ